MLFLSNAGFLNLGCWPMVWVMDCLGVTKRGAEVEKG